MALVVHVNNCQSHLNNFLLSLNVQIDKFLKNSTYGLSFPNDRAQQGTLNDLELVSSVVTIVNITAIYELT